MLCSPCARPGSLFRRELLERVAQSWSARDRAANLLGPRHAEVARVSITLGNGLDRLGDRAKRSPNTATPSRSPVNRWGPMTRSSRARSSTSRTSRHPPRPSSRSANARWRSRNGYPKRRPDTADSHAQIGAVLSHLRRDNEAGRHLERALEIYTAIHGADHPDTASRWSSSGCSRRGAATTAAR